MAANFPKPLLNSAAAKEHGASISRAQARALALEAGFAEAGLVALPHADEARDAARFEEWVRAGRAGTMRYLERGEPEGKAARLVRSRVAIPFPWARSVLVCMANYNSRQPRERVGLRATPGRAEWMQAAQGGQPITTRCCSSG